jgi:hypothetical protein
VTSPPPPISFLPSTRFSPRGDSKCETSAHTSRRPERLSQRTHAPTIVAPARTGGCTHTHTERSAWPHGPARPRTAPPERRAHASSHCPRTTNLAFTASQRTRHSTTAAHHGPQRACFFGRCPSLPPPIPPLLSAPPREHTAHTSVAMSPVTAPHTMFKASHTPQPERATRVSETEQHHTEHPTAETREKGRQRRPETFGGVDFDGRHESDCDKSR